MCMDDGCPRQLVWEMPGVLKRDYVEAPDEHHALKRHHLSGE